MDLGLASLGGNLGGGLLSGAFNAWSAEKQMDWQEYMSNTAYQRAAADLQKAGLNRVLALGSPASTPGGASATMAPLNLGDAYTSGKSAQSAVDLQKKQIGVMDSQIGVNNAMEAKTRSDTELNLIAGEKMMQDMQATRFGLPGITANNAKIQQELLNLKESLLNIRSQTRLNNANASEAEFKKAFYDKAAPVIRALLDKYAPTPNNANEAASGVGSAYDSLVDGLANYFLHLEGVARDVREARGVK